MLSPQNKKAYIGLGGNEGDVLSCFRFALNAFSQLEMRVIQVSSAYRTVALTLAEVVEPVADYWNAVCEVETNLSPREILNHLLSVERECGRIRSERWGSRPLDLDLLVYGDTHLNEEDLTVPHPRMRERAFVMRPLCQIAPELCLPPDGKTVQEVDGLLPVDGDGILARKPF